MIDAHAHIAISFSKEEQVTVMSNYKKNGGTKVVDVATCSEDISKVIEFINKFESAYATVGIHPEISPNINIEDEIQTIKSAINHKKIIGIGEIGLDFLAVDKNDSLDFQIELLTKQLLIAKENKLPLVIHARGRDYNDLSAYTQILELLEKEDFKGRVYFHSFGGDKKIAYQMVDKGYVLGVNGIATYTGAKQIAEAISSVPLSSLLLETDTPYLIPSNMDRELLIDKKRNEPSAILFTAKRIAKLKDISLEEVLETTEKTTLEFFDRI